MKRERIVDLLQSGGGVSNKGVADGGASGGVTASSSAPSTAVMPDCDVPGAVFSFEFFPAASPDAVKNLDNTFAELSKLHPAFVSVTTGAGGSSCDKTFDTVAKMYAQSDFPVMPHLTASRHTRQHAKELLDRYTELGVANILALAGDPAGPEQGAEAEGEFQYAIELVEFIKKHSSENSSNFCVGVAAHPEVHPRSVSRNSDRKYLAEKLKVADFAITQFFFDAQHYFRLVAELSELNCDKPVIPGVMPPVMPSLVKRFADQNGTAIDADFWQKLEEAEPEERKRLAVESTVELCQELLEGKSPGIHLYTMNKHCPVMAVMDILNPLNSKTT